MCSVLYHMVLGLLYSGAFYHLHGLKGGTGHSEVCVCVCNVLQDDVNQFAASSVTYCSVTYITYHVLRARLRLRMCFKCPFPEPAFLLHLPRR